MDMKLIQREWLKYCNWHAIYGRNTPSWSMRIFLFEQALKRESRHGIKFEWSDDRKSVTINNVLVLTVPENE